MNYKNVATAVFSHPPIATVGLNEEDANKQYGDKVVVFKSTFTNMIYSPVEDDNKKLKSLFKLVCIETGPEVEENGNAHLKVVGANGIGRNIDEMIQLISVALNMGATKQDFDNSVAVHPTASEEWVLFATKFVNKDM